MKKRNLILTLAAFSITVTVVMFTLMLSSNTVADTPGEVGGVLTAFGTGTISAEPDIAILSISVVTRGRDTTIQSENSETMDKVIAAVKGAGVEEKDIITSNYFMNPEYDWSDNRQRVIGYVIRNTISVTVRDIDRAGEILGLAERAGANEIGGVSFSVSNPEVYQRRALEMAIADSRAKADVMARAAGVVLRETLSIAEGINTTAVTSRNMLAAAPMAESMDMGRGASIATGDITITANVTMVFGY